ERESENRRLAYQLKCLNEEVHQQRVRSLSMEQRLKSLQTAEQVALSRQQQLEQLQQQLATLEHHDAAQAPPEQAPDTEAGEDAQALLDHLLRVQEALESYYLVNQRLKQALSPLKRTVGTSPPPPALAPVCDDRPLGAAERVRTSLEYRLGASLIRCSRSMGGWFSMPIVARHLIRQHRAQQDAGDTLLPSIDSYRDAPAAVQLRSHLSYRLGHTYLTHTSLFLGWMRLPWALL